LFGDEVQVACNAVHALPRRNLDEVFIDHKHFSMSEILHLKADYRKLTGTLFGDWCPLFITLFFALILPSFITYHL